MYTQLVELIREAFKRLSYLSWCYQLIKLNHKLVLKTSIQLTIVESQMQICMEMKINYYWHQK